MTSTAWVLFALAAGFALGNWISVLVNARVGIFVCKPMTLALLIATAVVLDPTYGNTRTWFVVALVFSLLGDVLLMLPEKVFVFGLGAFLLGHVAYAIGMNLHTDGLWLLAVPIPFIAALLARRLVRGLKRGGNDALVAPVIAYVVVITVMVVSAFASGNAVMVVGAALFMVSDSLIGENRFVQPRAWGPVAIMVTYHLGQGLLVLSLVS